MARQAMARAPHQCLQLQGLSSRRRRWGRSGACVEARRASRDLRSAATALLLAGMVAAQASVPSAQIDTDNVGRLQLAFSYGLAGAGALASAPASADGLLFVLGTF